MSVEESRMKQKLSHIPCTMESKNRQYISFLTYYHTPPHYCTVCQCASLSLHLSVSVLLFIQHGCLPHSTHSLPSPMNATIFYDRKAQQGERFQYTYIPCTLNIIMNIKRLLGVVKLCTIIVSIH